MQESVFAAVEAILQEHDESHPSKAINMVLPEVTLARLKELRELLKPFGAATDRLQGDGVTSSSLHLCIATCYVTVDDMICEEYVLQNCMLIAVSHLASISYPLICSLYVSVAVSCLFHENSPSPCFQLTRHNGIFLQVLKIAAESLAAVEGEV